MDGTPWILIDTETTGFTPPVYTLELAAQRMNGWERDGEPFRRLLNHNCAIPEEAARVHGYTREILERDGDPPEKVYRDFAEYARGAPIVAYNLPYDWDRVLAPEWQRLGIPAIGVRGFCALILAQRLLDPVPAENCKLQTLRRYYRLPERGAHTALGDVETVIDLMQQVLRPIVENRGLDTWEKIKNCTEQEWFPSRLPFGKFKGRPFFEAHEDSALKAWVEWLAESKNEKSSRMGRWYLERLTDERLETESAVIEFPEDDQRASGLVVFLRPEVEHYSSLVDSQRARLADLELEFGIEKAKVDSIRARLFEGLRPLYEERDRLRTVIRYRSAFIDTLLSDGEEAAEGLGADFERETKEKAEEYESTASSLKGKRVLTDEETTRLKKLWKKLVRMFHPDLYEQDPEKKETYERLTQAINAAKDSGDIDLLERIARDPESFILSQGWALITLDEAKNLRELRSLFEYLQLQILGLIESLEAMRASAEYELFGFAQQDEAVLERVIGDQSEELQAELETLRAEADRKGKEIEELTGSAPF